MCEENIVLNGSTSLETSSVCIGQFSKAQLKQEIIQRGKV